MRQGFIFSLLWLVPLLLFPRQAKPISAVIGVVLWASSLVNLGYFIIYRQEFTQSVLFIVFESNPAEASEYVGQYFVWWMIPAAMAYSAIAFWLWRGIRPLQMKPAGRWAMLTLIGAALLLPPAIKVGMKYNFNPDALVNAYANRM